MPNYVLLTSGLIAMLLISENADSELGTRNVTELDGTCDKYQFYHCMPNT